jgi:predicted glycosyltransferase involved in capsule biosynthesis
MYPYFAKALFSKALTSFSFKQSSVQKHSDKPIEVSFIIGHRGSKRIELLLKTIESIAAQENCVVECIVVEQDHTSIIREFVPAWVKLVFTQVDADMPYSRSQAFNEGALHASGECLIFHDNDLLVPCQYAYETLAIYKRGYDFINLKRFIFYLSKGASENFIENGNLNKTLEIESIMQNAEGGGSIGGSKQAFERIGGFDQRFVGWGGEDNEFWERALTQKVWSHGYLPLIHLWHESQTEKLDVDGSKNKALYNTLSDQSPDLRIETLGKRYSKESSGVIVSHHELL